MKPIIAIVAKIELNEVGKGVKWQFCKINDYVRYALNKNGALVGAILPQQNTLNCTALGNTNNQTLSEQEKKDIIYFVNQYDGIVLQGGIYSDAFETFISHFCFINDIPLLGTCAGQSEMLYGNGGSAKKHNDEKRHYRPDLKHAHNMKVVKDTKFAKIFGCGIFPINSIHNNEPNELGEFVPSAYSDDGQIEVIEHPNKRFCLGVRFHPELLVDCNTRMNNIFKMFVKACKDFSKSKSI